MASSYWARILDQRVARRRAMAVTGGMSAAAVLLAACGGDESTGGNTADQTGNGLIAQPLDTTKQAVRGGTLKWFAPSEPRDLDVHIDQAPKNVFKNLAIGHFVNEKPGKQQAPSYEEYVPEMMESWEWSADKLQLTFKMRQGVKWHNKPPVNGRLMDTEDILFSMERFAAKGNDRRFLFNSANPNAPVLSVTAPDSKTIVFKLKEPIVYLLSALTPAQTGKPSIIPKETDTTFDIRKDMIGTGPFIMENYTPTVSFSFVRNKDYFDKTYPLVDRIEMPLLPEYSSALAQFKAGEVYTYSSGNNAVRADDIMPLKRENPEMNMYERAPSGVSIRALGFGQQPVGNNPFTDERVRQAVSMTLDRELYIETFFNVDHFKKEGLPVTSYWFSHVDAGSGGWWLDPRSKNFGPNAKFFQHNIPEAKKLLAAAGHPDGFDVVSSYIGGPQLGADFQRQVAVREEMAKEAGFNPIAHVIDYSSEYAPIYRDGQGDYEGWAYRAGGSPANDPIAYFTTKYHHNGGPGFVGFDAAGKGDMSGDPAFEAMISKANGELDVEKRRALVFDMQRYLAQKMYDVPDAGEATFFYLAWPVLENFSAYQGDRRGDVYYWWLNKNKKPLGG